MTIEQRTKRLKRAVNVIDVLEIDITSQEQMEIDQLEQIVPEQDNYVLSGVMNQSSHVLLATACVKLIIGQRAITVRALLDSGAQLGMITQNMIRSNHLQTESSTYDTLRVKSEKCKVSNANIARNGKF